HWYDAGLPRPELQVWVYDDDGVGVYRLDIACSSPSTQPSTTARRTTPPTKTPSTTRSDVPGARRSAAGTSRSSPRPRSTGVTRTPSHCYELAWHGPGASPAGRRTEANVPPLVAS